MSKDDRSYDTTAKKELATPTAQKMLRQFMKNPEGNHAVNPAYDRGYEFNFRYSDAERALVNRHMETYGVTFEVAFDRSRASILEGRKQLELDFGKGQE